MDERISRRKTLKGSGSKITPLKIRTTSSMASRKSRVSMLNSSKSQDRIRNMIQLAKAKNGEE